MFRFSPFCCCCLFYRWPRTHIPSRNHSSPSAATSTLSLMRFSASSVRNRTRRGPSLKNATSPRDIIPFNERTEICSAAAICVFVRHTTPRACNSANVSAPPSPRRGEGRGEVRRVTPHSALRTPHFIGPPPPLRSRPARAPARPGTGACRRRGRVSGRASRPASAG